VGIRAFLRYSTDKITFALRVIKGSTRAYAEAIDGAVYLCRDARGLACDVIIEFGDGRWGAVEIKIESSNEDIAAANLLKIKREVRSQHGGEAAFLMTVMSGGVGYRREDGVHSVPIGCLRP
jgi:hypothetical protein